MNLKNIYLYLLNTLLLLSPAMPTIAQSPCLDSLRLVEQSLTQQSQALQLEYDSLYRIIAQCKTDDELLMQFAVKDKLDKRNDKLAQRIRKIEGEIEVERARIEQVEREERLATKQAKAQAISPVPLKGELNTHPWVDLGLPSGTKWATYNVGTSQIHGVGTRVAWGETSTKKTFSPAAYTLNDVELLSYAGDPQYDLATAQWGEGWYTPTKQQWDELIEHCDWDYVMINGIHGVLLTSRKTYNTIFLPSTGYTDDETYKLKYTTYNLAYWSSTTQRNNGAFSYIANYEQGYVTSTNRYVAHCVRTVCGVSSELAGTAHNTADMAQTIQETISSVQQTTSEIQEPSNQHQQNTRSAKQTAQSVKQATNTVKQAANTVKTLQKIFGR